MSRTRAACAPDCALADAVRDYARCAKAALRASPSYSHCNFTAPAGLAPSLAERFTKAIQAMDYNDPRWKQVMKLEGLTRWMPGNTAGYADLEREARRLEMVSESA